ncbi:MAG TPA: hypothetical protein VGZ04_09730, partial [Acidimicrobiales bacterium]|nr:hypothetical protein [Acidimicrobiales bacterium]
MREFPKRVRARSGEDREKSVGLEPVRAVRARASGEDGAILILAFVYLVAVSLVITMLSTWVTNDLNNSTRFTAANSTTLAAT